MRAAKTKTEIAFVDCGIDDVSALVAGLRPEAEPILLSPDEPAIRHEAGVHGLILRYHTRGKGVNANHRQSSLVIVNHRQSRGIRA